MKTIYVAPGLKLFEVHVRNMVAASIPQPKNIKGVQQFDDDDNEYTW